jgi:hypothetical protein
MPGDAKKPAQQKVEKRYKKKTIDSANSHNKFDPLPYLLINWPSNEDNQVIPVVEKSGFLNGWSQFAFKYFLNRCTNLNNQI